MSGTTLSQSQIFVRQKNNSDNWEYSTDSVDYTEIVNYPVHLDSYSVYIYGDLYICSAEHYFNIIKDFVNISGYQQYKILSRHDGQFTYGGLFRNYNATTDSSYNGINIEFIYNYATPSLETNSGYLIAQNFGRNALSPGSFSNLRNYVNIPDNCAGIIGKNLYYNTNLQNNLLYTFNVVNCINYGSIGLNSAGIAYSANKTIVSFVNCINFGTFDYTGGSGIASCEDNISNPIFIGCVNARKLANNYCSGLGNIYYTSILDNLNIGPLVLAENCISSKYYLEYGGIDGQYCAGLVTLKNYSNKTININSCYNIQHIIGNNSSGLVLYDHASNTTNNSLILEYVYHHADYNNQNSNSSTILQVISNVTTCYTTFNINNVYSSINYSSNDSKLIFNAPNDFNANISNFLVEPGWNRNNAIEKLHKVRYINNIQDFNYDDSEHIFVDVSVLDADLNVTYSTPFKLKYFNYNLFVKSDNKPHFVNLYYNNNIYPSNSNTFYGKNGTFGQLYILNTNFTNSNNQKLYSTGASVSYINQNNVVNTPCISVSGNADNTIAGKIYIYHTDFHTQIFGVTGCQEFYNIFSINVQVDKYNPQAAQYLYASDDIYIKQNPNNELKWIYSIDNEQTYNDILNYPVGLGNIEYKVYIKSNLNISSSNHYLIMAGNNITIDGNNYAIQGGNNINYQGFIQNTIYDDNNNQPINSYINSYVQNISHKSSVNLTNGGYLIRNNYGYNSTGHRIKNLYNHTNINNNCGGIIGSIHLNLDMEVRDCINYGNLHENCSGIMSYCNNSFIFLYNCHNFGHINGSNSNGISSFINSRGNCGSNQLVSKNTFTSRCSNHGNINYSNSCGIAQITFTSNVFGSETGNISYCYNTGNINGVNSSGIATFTSYFNNNDTVNNYFKIYSCYNTGAINSNDSCGVAYFSDINKNFNLTLDAVYNTGIIKCETQSGILNSQSNNSLITASILNSYSISPTCYNNIAICNNIQNITTNNSGTSTSWNFNNAKTFLGKGQDYINYNLNNYNNWHFYGENYSYDNNIIYPYIDVSKVEADGIIINHIPFKLAVFSFNPYASNDTIQLLNLNIQQFINVNTNLKYYNVSPPFGISEIVTSDILDTNNHVSYSNCAAFDGSINGKIIFNINLNTQTHKKMLLYTRNVLSVFSGNASNFYIIYNLNLSNIYEQPAVAPTEPPAEPPTQPPTEPQTEPLTEPSTEPPIISRTYSSPIVQPIFYNTNTTFNFKFIPNFIDINNSPAEHSLWRYSNPATPENTFKLFERQQLLKNYINFTNLSINSDRYSFAVLYSPQFLTGTQFKIKSFKIRLHEAFKNYITLDSIGINTNRTNIGNTLGATHADYSANHVKFKLNFDQVSNMYTKDVGSDSVIIDTDNPSNLFFSFWLNSVITPKINISILQIFLNISNIILINMEVLGEYINPNHATVNQKIPLNSYKIYVAEYLKSLTICENDSDANTNIILPEQLTTVNILNVINTIQQFGTGLNEVYKIRKYKLGNGLLYNSDISGSTLAATIKIKKLRIVKGELKVKKQLNTPGLIYDSFFFEIHPEDVKLLPNNKDKYLYIITEPTSESLINISLSNPLEF